MIPQPWFRWSWDLQLAVFHPACTREKVLPISWVRTGSCTTSTPAVGQWPYGQAKPAARHLERCGKGSLLRTRQTPAGIRWGQGVPLPRKKGKHHSSSLQKPRSQQRRNAQQGDDQEPGHQQVHGVGIWRPGARVACGLAFACSLKPPFWPLPRFCNTNRRHNLWE